MFGNTELLLILELVLIWVFVIILVVLGFRLVRKLKKKKSGNPCK